MLKKKKFDIIICVHNSPQYLRQCLNSIFRCTNEDIFNIILVDDFSDQLTKETIDEFKKNYENIIEVISNNTNLGYVKSANEGIRKSTSDNVVLVNTDVIVTNGWLTKFEIALKSDPSIGLISPLSNNAVNLSIKMPPGFDYIQMNEFIEKFSRKLYPDAMTVVGHCLLITKKVIETIGAFDEIYSPAYGEETDYHFLAINNGFRAVIADDTYVYHKGEGSIKNRDKLFLEHIKIFNERWGEQFNKLLREYDHKDELGYLRNQKTQFPLFEEFGYVPKSDVVFFLPGLSGGIGGITTVVEIVNGLLQLGIRANIAYLGKKVIDLDLIFEPHQYEHEEQFLTFPPDTKVLVATEYSTVDAVKKIAEKYKIKSAYFIQDYEGWFEPVRILQAVKNTYSKINEKICVSKWLQKMLKEQDDYESTVLNVGMSAEFFYPRNEHVEEIEELRQHSKLIVLSLLSPNERRGTIYFIQAMRELLKETKDISFVVTQRSKHFLQDTSHEKILDLGMLHRNETPKYFSACDVIVDTSLYHGFGLPGLEGISCGLAAILTDVEIEYAEDKKNCILVPTKTVAQIKKAILTLRDNPQLLADLKKNGRETAKNFDWGKLVPKYKNYFQKLIDTYDSSAKRPRFRYLELLSHKHLLEVIDQKVVSQNPIKYSKNLATPRETIEIFRFYAKQHGFGKAMKECWKWFFK